MRRIVVSKLRLPKPAAVTAPCLLIMLTLAWPKLSRRITRLEYYCLEQP